MKKYLIILLSLLTLVGCKQKVVYLDENGNAIENPLQQKEVDYINYSGDRFEIVEKITSELKEVRDTQTGVHYYYFYVGYGMTLTPIYESDGSIRVSK